MALLLATTGFGTNCAVVPHTAVANPALSPIPPCRHSRRPHRRPLCCHFVTGRFVVVVVVVVVVVAVVVAPSLHGRQRSLRAADSHRYCTVVVSWSHHRHAVVTPSSRHCHTIFAPSVVIVVRLAPRRVCRRVGLASEWWWWLAVGVHMWEWRRWWASVSPLHTGYPLYSRDSITGTQSTTPPCPVPCPPPPAAAGLRPIKDTFFYLSPCGRLCLHFAAHKPVAAASNPSPRTSPPPPPPLTVHKSRRNATATRVQPPPLQHRHTARNPHCYNTATQRATSTATTPTTTVTWREQHGGRNDGDADDDGDGM
ncbi:hypothetical protein EDB84DRAFT_1433152 [Lactarius hengduanensis]|nr:hypothetical protein EDB84DRAFT_1433152 [Lactarius hengduanensis]